MSANLNWLDRSIGWISPSAGLRRARARMASEILSSYEGARMGRRTEGWITTGSDSNSAIGPDLAKLRERSHDLVRNNPHARSAKVKICSHAVGTGLIPQADTGNPSLNKTIDSVFKPFSEQCDAAGQLDFFGIQRMGVDAMFESGEAVIRRRFRRASDGFKVPLKYQVLEADYIDLNRNLTDNNSGGLTIQGIERNLIGERTGYWMFGNHPGAQNISFKLSNLTSKVIPASEIIHAYPHDRPGQEHGVPFLAPAMILLNDMQDYNEAEILRAKIQACIAIGVTQAEDPDTRTIAPSGREESTGKRLEFMRPAMVVYGKPGEEIDIKAPTGHANFAEFMKLEQHLMAIAVGMFYAQLTGDLSSVNWASYRAGDRDFRAMIEAFRWLCVIPMLCNPMWRWFIDTAFLNNLIPEQNYGVAWTPPQFMSVDPLKDAEADEAELANGAIPYPEMVTRRGGDPEKTLAAIQAWQKKVDAAGVIFQWDRRHVDSRGRVQATPPGDVSQN